MKKKIALAYSGGLDTSVMIRWFIENLDAEVIAVNGNLGGEIDAKALEAKALATGAIKAVVKDLRSEFLTDFAFPALQAGALYEGVYPLATAIGRPLLAKLLVEVAKEEGCDAIAHGCTGKGNDQVRFEVTAAALAPELEVLAPLRTWEFHSREEEMEYAAKHNIPVSATKKSPYSIDSNLWGTSIECGVLEDPTVAPPEDAYQSTTSPENAPNKPEIISITFEGGIPTHIEGTKMNAVDLVRLLNTIGGNHGVGRIDLVENRLVGIKSREIYEAPGAVILHTAHRELERLVLERSVFRWKDKIAQEYADVIYNGLWFSPLREAFDAFIKSTQERVSGEVKLKLFKGNATVVGRSSKYSLYDESLATYTSADTFKHDAAEGFIHCWGLPVKTYWQRERMNGNMVVKK